MTDARGAGGSVTPAGQPRVCSLALAIRWPLAVALLLAIAAAVLLPARAGAQAPTIVDTTIDTSSFPATLTFPRPRRRRGRPRERRALLPGAPRGGDHPPARRSQRQRRGPARGRPAHEHRPHLHPARRDHRVVVGADDDRGRHHRDRAQQLQLRRSALRMECHRRRGARALLLRGRSHGPGPARHRPRRDHPHVARARHGDRLPCPHLPVEQRPGRLGRRAGRELALRAADLHRRHARARRPRARLLARALGSSPTNSPTSSPSRPARASPPCPPGSTRAPLPTPSPAGAPAAASPCSARSTATPSSASAPSAPTPTPPATSTCSTASRPTSSPP